LADGPAGAPPREADPLADGTSADGTWLELSVVADPEAVEAVSEILTRYAPGGTSVEPAFDLVDEGLGARLDPTRPAVVRAYLPGRDAQAMRRAVDEASRALGHLQAFVGLGECLETAFPRAPRRASDRHPADVATAPADARRRGDRAGSGHGVRDRAASDHQALPRRDRAHGR
jgi:hypothetical protein